ncbi:hypothetical protein Celaphus_00001665, partial [Cervus elaphus hippelaphus]
MSRLLVGTPTRTRTTCSPKRHRGLHTAFIMSLLGSVHFLLLVFLKVPLLLGLLGAILWAHRPLRSSADRRSRPIYENHHIGPACGNQGKETGPALCFSLSPCCSHQPREAHRLPRLSHDPARAHLEHRIRSGDPRSRPPSSVPLLLGLLGAVLWVHRPLRSSEN